MVAEKALREIEGANLEYIVGYVICLNPEEQERDRSLREEAVAKLRAKLARGEVKQLIGNSFPSWWRWSLSSMARATWHGRNWWVMPTWPSRRWECDRPCT